VATNTLAYLPRSILTTKKKFYDSDAKRRLGFLAHREMGKKEFLFFKAGFFFLGPGVDVISLVTSVIYECLL
jgi:hypothetical protein